MSIKFSGANLNINADVNINGLEELINVLKSIDAKLGREPEINIGMPQIQSGSEISNDAEISKDNSTQSAQESRKVPVSSVAYTLPQLQAAAAKLIHGDDEKRSMLQQVLKGLGVNSIMELSEDKLNAFAQGIRNLGGVI